MKGRRVFYGEGEERPRRGSGRVLGDVFMKCGVYLLAFDTGKHYLGSTNDVARRLEQHRSQQVYSTARLGKSCQLVGFQEVATLKEARVLERRYKTWKNYAKVKLAMNEKGSSPDAGRGGS